MLRSLKTQPVSPFVLLVPDGLPEEWLSRFDVKPHVVPTWPLSERMALVAMVVTDIDTPMETITVYVLTEQQQVEAAIDFDVSSSKLVTLFFTVPKSKLLPYCEGLTLEAWQLK